MIRMRKPAAIWLTAARTAGRPSCARFPRVDLGVEKLPAAVWTTLALGLWAISARPIEGEARLSRQPVDVSRLGPQVGQRVPDFTLEDQNGKQWTLPSIMGPKGAMLVFFRSADW
jgi:hypothetical protein